MNSGLTHESVYALLMSGSNLFAGTFEGSVFIKNIATELNEKTRDPFEVIMFPNPAGASFTVTANGALDNGWIEIYNVLGEKVYAENVESSSADYTKQMNLPEIPSGIYMVKVYDGTKQVTKKISIENN